MDVPPARIAPRVITGLDPTGDNTGGRTTHFLHLSWPGMARPCTACGDECVRAVGAFAKPQTHQDRQQGEHYLAGSAALPTVIPGLAPGIAADTGFCGGARIKAGHDVEIKSCASGPYPDAYGAKPGHDTKEYAGADRRIMRSVRRLVWV